MKRIQIKRPALYRQLLSIPLLAVLAMMPSGLTAELIEAPKSVGNQATEQTASKVEINSAEAKQEGKTEQDIVRHKWEKVDRSKVGGKEENTTIVQVVKFHGLIEEVIWCKSDNQSTFAMSYEGEVYVSRDHGVNWHNLQPMILKSTHRSWGISWKMSFMMQAPGNRDNIIVSSDANNVWVTKDCGETWKLVADHLNLYGFRFHPHVPGKILALHRHTCTRKTSPDCVPHNVLYLSEDHGFTWKPIEKFVYRYVWGREAHYSFGIGANAIFITKQEDETKKQPKYMKHFTKHSKISVFYSDNFFNTTRKIVDEGFSMMVSRCCLFVQSPTDMGTKLSVSEVWNRKFYFKDVAILDDYDYKNFRILNELQSFYTYMYATREVGENGLVISDLLKSDYSNHNFSLVEKSLVVNAANEVPSFTEITAFHGISIINSYDDKFLDYVDRVSEGLTKKSTVERANKFIRTKISFNNGANYQFIKPPAVDSNGEPYPECSDCYLHLHTQDSSDFPQVYSAQSAPGIIIGVGNVGRHLSFDARELGTFISTDGGISWREALKGVHIYEIGDQGGLIVLAPFNVPNKMVIFSHDYCKTFKFVEYTKVISTVVSNIIMEPTNNSHQFFIVSSSKTSEREDGILVHLDFKEYHSRRCQGHSHPENLDSDYEKIVPHTYKNKQCLLGKNGFYVRKKPDAKCINPDHYEYFHISHLCKCTEQDWECDVGFTKAGGDESTTCVPLPDYKEPEAPKNCRMYYFISSGYRRVADNVCQGGVKHDKIRKPCPGGLGFIGLIFIFLMRIILYGGGILILYIAGTYIYERMNAGESPLGYESIGNLADKAKGYFSTASGQGYEGIGQDNQRVPGLLDDDNYDMDDDNQDGSEDEDEDDI